MPNSLSHQMPKPTRKPSAAGALLLSHLRHRALTQAACASLVGMNRTMLVDIIRDRRSIPPDRFPALADALALTESERNALALADANDRLRRSQERQSAQ